MRRSAHLFRGVIASVVCAVSVIACRLHSSDASLSSTVDKKG